MMNVLDDEFLADPRESSATPTASPARSKGSWVAAALVAVAAGVAAYIAFVWRPSPPPAATATVTPTPPAAVEAPLSLGGEAEPIAVPPLDASDAVVKTLVGALSRNPALAAWLTTNGLIRNFTVVVGNVAEGAAPVKHLAVLRPSSSFRTVEREGDLHVDPRSYHRYTAIADAIASIDPEGASSVYATLKPRIEEAHQELGYRDQSFDRTLERAIIALLNTPVPVDPVRLRPKGIVYAYEDDALEALTNAQKHLFRMGPRNVRIIKEQLRQIALTLGVPATRLPPG
jgi:hypothetical protein